MKIKREFTKKDVAHIAKVYRIQLTGKEELRLVYHLETTAGHLKVFQKTKKRLKNLKPTYHPTSFPDPLRKDIAEKPLSYKKAMLNAPRRYKGFFLVPPVVWSKKENDSK